MIANTTALHGMCGALPVSPEDAPGIIEAADRLKWDRRLLDYSYAPGNYMIICWSCKQQVHDCDKRALRCLECAQAMLNEQLSRDLIEAAREPKGG